MYEISPCKTFFIYNAMHRENKRNVTFDHGLLKWKHMQIYVFKGKLRTRIVEEEHDVFTMKHQGKNSTRWLWLNIFISPK